MSALVIDLGGTRVKAGVVRDGALGSVVVEEISGSAVDAIATAGKSVLGGGTATHAALCVPGLVDEDGTLVSLPGKHAGLEGTNFHTQLREMFAAQQTAVTNDAIAYAIGEAVAGAGRGTRRSVVVTIGTGVGVTVIQDGEPVTPGVFGGGILGGFIPIAETSDEVDTAGQRGTIEALCAAERIAGDAYGSVPDVYKAFANGESKARPVIEHYRERLVRALTALASAHTPERIILGGGPMTPDNPITPGIQELVNARMFGTYRTEVRLAELGDTAALIGLGSLLKVLA